MSMRCGGLSLHNHICKWGNDRKDFNPLIFTMKTLFAEIVEKENLVEPFILFIPADAG